MNYWNIAFIIGFVLLQQLMAVEKDWQTDFERSGYLETPRYEQTVDYCKRLADASPLVRYTEFGRSAQGRPLPLLIVNSEGLFTPGEVRGTEQVVFYIQACIHAGEPDGKDAGLMLLRDLIIKHKHGGLPEHVTILFNPIFNVDGHERFGAYNRANQNGPAEMGWRVTAQNLNLNRDYLKADAPEMRHWLKLYTDWLPDFFADCHVTDGADYQYPISYKIETHGILDTTISAWLQNEWLPPVRSAMSENGFPLTPYVWFRDAHDVQSGLGTWAAPPRFSDGYAAIQNRPALLIETHMFKDYRTRVSATYQLLMETLKLLNANHAKLRQLIKQADTRTADPAFRDQPFTLTYLHSSDSTMIDFAGFGYSKEKSDLSGGDWYRYDRTDPQTFRIPYYHSMQPGWQIRLPLAYIVPAQWKEVIRRMDWHGIEMFALADADTIPADTYRFSNIRFRPTPYEGRQTVEFDYEPFRKKIAFPAGSAVVLLNQRAAKVAVNILEPKAPDSFLQWGFFNTIFERKEYVESYVMEERARLMLASDTALKHAFEERITADSSFAADPRAILMWFYRHSPYWDEQKDIYPVGRIFENDDLNSLNLIQRDGYED